jgi:hypothetical protein
MEHVPLEDLDKQEENLVVEEDKDNTNQTVNKTGGVVPKNEAEPSHIYAFNPK